MRPSRSRPIAALSNPLLLGASPRAPQAAHPPPVPRARRPHFSQRPLAACNAEFGPKNQRDRSGYSTGEANGLAEAWYTSG